MYGKRKLSQRSDHDQNSCDDQPSQRVIVDTPGLEASNCEPDLREDDSCACRADKLEQTLVKGLKDCLVSELKQGLIHETVVDCVEVSLVRKKAVTRPEPETLVGRGNLS